MPAWGTHLNVAQTGRINAFLKRAYKWLFGGAPYYGTVTVQLCHLPLQ